MRRIRAMWPKDCQGKYVPWVCGFCELMGDRCPFMGRGKRKGWR